MSKERELLMRWLSGEANEMPTHIPLLIETQNLLAQPEHIEDKLAMAEFKKGYMIGFNVAVRDLKQKVDSVFNLILEDDDE